MSNDLRVRCVRVIARGLTPGWRRPLALVLVATALGCSPETPAPERVLLVTIDTLRADHVGCYGAERARTPTLDALAGDGVRFDAAISPTPLTLPSHSTIHTGLDPDRHGIRHNGVFALAPEVPTLAERMRAQGFATAAFVGAFVLDHRFGLARGFDHYDDAIGARRSSPGMVGYAERRADEVVDAFLAWLPRAPERFFAWVHVYDPHSEYDPPAGFQLGFARNPYDGEIAFVDAQLARLLGALDARFPREGTLIVATSDHGEALGEHGEPTHSYSIYEATQRVPLIASGPGFRGGRAVPDVVSLADLAPTLIAAVGAEAIPGTDGRDLRRVVAGRAPAARAYSETLATHIDYGWSALFASRDARWRYIEAPTPELYDIGADPHERRNVVAEHPDVAREHASWLAERRSRTGPAATEREISTDERAKLAALGYVVGSQATQLGDLSGPDPKDRMEVLAAQLRASALGDRGRWAEAFETLRPFPEQGMMFSTIRATAAIFAGRLDEAERDLTAALELHPDDAALLRTLALAKERRQDWSAAQTLYARAAVADPTDFAAPTGQGRVAEAQGDAGAAAGHYRAALAIWPGAINAKWSLAALTAQQGDLAAGQAMVTEAPAPTDLAVAYRFAVVEAAAGQVESAARRLEQALVGTEQIDPVELTLPIAALLEAGGRTGAAVRVSEAALRRDPGSVPYQNGVAWGLALEGRDLDRALELARAAEKESGSAPEVLDTLAAVQLARKEPQAALGVVERALAGADPMLHAHLYFLKARALADLGRPREAARAIRRSLDLRAPGATPQRSEADSLARELGVDTSASAQPP